MIRRDSERLNRRGAAVWLSAASLLAGVVLASGCSRNDASSVVGPQTATSASTAAGSTDAAPPTLAELRAAVSMTDAQAKVVGQALEAWTASTDGGSGSGGPPSGGGGPGRRGPGDRGPGGGRGPGGPAGDCGPAVAPPARFIEQTSAVLETAQLQTEASFLSDRQTRYEAACDSSRRPPPAPVGPILHQLAREFSLADATLRSLADAFRAAHKAVRDALAGYRAASTDEAALRSTAAAARDALVQALHGILATDQFDRLRALVADARTRGATCRLDHLSESVALRIEGLTRLLGLDATQALAVENALSGELPKLQSLFTGVRDGTLAFEDAVATGARIESGTTAAIRALLTPDQLARFDATRPVGRGPVPEIYF